MQYQHFLFVFLFVVGMAFAVPSPHIGMVDDDRVRDVGAVYSQPGYSSKPTFLLMDKQEPRCVPLINNVVSIMICVESIACDFWKDKGCGSMADEEAVFTVGCGDVHKLPLPLTGTYGSYKCHHVDPDTLVSEGTILVETTPHDPNNDVLGQDSLPVTTMSTSM